MDFVSLDRVSLCYGGEGTLALADTTLAVAEGEFVAVVGPSGCGKSSLMKVVTGLAPPSGGRVTVNGARLTSSEGDGVNSRSMRPSTSSVVASDGNSSVK